MSLKKGKCRLQDTLVNGWAGVKAGDALGRIYTVHVSNLQRCCLRILLNVTQGPLNLFDLKTVDTQERETFRQACEVRVVGRGQPLFERMDQVNNDLCLNESVRIIKDKIIKISGNKLSDFGMPTTQCRGELSIDLIKELSYDTALLDAQVSDIEPRLLP
ncbi:uncharacterized protein TNCV_2734561 [Trichonephila clavipes]|nr:uncharacterized protein TNCV_2734561 [Trichonephila clavipes]